MRRIIKEKDDIKVSIFSGGSMREIIIRIEVICTILVKE